MKKEKNIYELLNEVETDYMEYEEEETSREEMEAHKGRVRQKVRQAEKEARAKKRKKAWKIAAGMAAAAVVAIGAAGAANPAFAEGVFSAVFGKLIQNAQEHPEDLYIGELEKYERVGKYAVPIEKEMERRQGEEGYVVSASDNGTTLSVSDVYCDGYVLYYALVLKTDNEKLAGKEQIDGWTDGPGLKIDVEGVGDSDEYYSLGWTDGPFTKIGENTYAKMNEIYLSAFWACAGQDLMQVALNPEKPGDVTGDCGNAATDDCGVMAGKTITVDLKTERLFGYDEAELEEGRAASGYDWGHDDASAQHGDWNLRFPVTIDNSQNTAFEIGKEGDGIQVKRAVKTKVALMLELEYAESQPKGYEARGCEFPEAFLEDYAQGANSCNDFWSHAELLVPDVSMSSEGTDFIPMLDTNAVNRLEKGGAVTSYVLFPYDGQKEAALEFEFLGVAADTEEESYDSIPYAKLGIQIP